MSHILLHCRSGSHAYGLATGTSDEDFRGVFLLPRQQFYGLNYIPQLSDETNDQSYYELGRFFELLMKANPTALELLATQEENRLFCHPALAELKVENFLTKACKETFAGYARSQVRKARGLNKKVHNPVAKDLKTVLEFCYILQDGKTIPAKRWLEEREIIQEQIGLAAVDHTRGIYAVYHDPGQSWARGIMRSVMANEVAMTPVPPGEKAVGYLSFNQDAYSTYRRDYREYWEWVEKRNDTRYQNTLNHGGGYDAKNMMHTIRLLEMACEIFQEETLNVKRPNRDFLLAVKGGKYSLEEVLGMAEDRLRKLDQLANDSKLPAKLDETTIIQKLVNIREVLYES